MLAGVKVLSHFPIFSCGQICSWHVVCLLNYSVGFQLCSQMACDYNFKTKTWKCNHIMLSKSSGDHRLPLGKKVRDGFPVVFFDKNIPVILHYFFFKVCLLRGWGSRRNMKHILGCWEGKAAGKFVCPLQHSLADCQPPFGKVPLSPGCLSDSWWCGGTWARFWGLGQAALCSCRNPLKSRIKPNQLQSQAVFSRQIFLGPSLLEVPGTTCMLQLWWISMGPSQWFLCHSVLYCHPQLQGGFLQKKISIGKVQRGCWDLFSYLIPKPFSTVVLGCFTLLLLFLFYSGLSPFLLAKSAGGYWLSCCSGAFCIKYWNSDFLLCLQLAELSWHPPGKVEV